MFPITAHSPDNSFMGFVVDNHINKSNAMYDTEVPRKNQALVYGKAEYMWDVSCLIALYVTDQLC